MSKEKFVRDKPHVNIGTILLIGFSIFSIFSLGILIYTDIMGTRDNDGDSIPDISEGNAGHPLFFDISDNALHFRTYEADTSSHELGHHLGLSHGGASSYLNVELDLFDDVSTMLPVLDFNIKFDSLIEFIDDDANGFFDPTRDIIIGKITLNNLIRLGFGFGVDKEPAYYSIYSTQNGIFKVNFFTAGEHVLLRPQVGLLNPFELKSSINIVEYTPITGGTNLALNISFSSSNDISLSGKTLTTRISSGDYKVTYEWYNPAIINDVETTLNTTVAFSPISMNNAEIYINFGDVINGTYNPKVSWKIPRFNVFNIFTDIPWSYLTIGSIGIIAAISIVKIVRKKPGRLTYQQIATSAESSKKSEKSEKRIPSTLTHRDR